VQRLLQHLSVYLGHVHLRHTQVYLSMTPELLREGQPAFRALCREGATPCLTPFAEPWVRRFLLEYLIAERNLARNTQKVIGMRCSSFCRSLLASPTDGSSGSVWRTFRQPVPELPSGFGKELAAAGSPREISVSRDPFLGAIHRPA